MRVLVTGTDGYIGSHLAPWLRHRGHDVTGLDTGYYAEGCLYDPAESLPTAVRRDTREITPDDLRGFEAVVHLAELSNDPLGQLNPALTFRINHEASVRLARLCREAGVARFVYSSSCSVYGAGADAVRVETSEPQPQTAYAECKVLAERDVGALAAPGFTPTFLRNATAFGASPRMRFDIVLNNLAGMAWTTHEIAMVSDGTPWRPLVHVLDICEAMACVWTHRPRRCTARSSTWDRTSRTPGPRDRRDHRRGVSRLPAELRHHGQRSPQLSGRVRQDPTAPAGLPLPARCPSWCPGAAGPVRSHRADPGDVRSRHFTRLKHFEYLLAHGRLDPDLRWVRS